MEGLIQGSPEWLEWRRQGIGASEVAAVIGVCKYSTPYKVWLEKTGQSKGFAGNFATERGSLLEPKARSRYELMFLEDMKPVLAEHPAYKICRSSLDGISEDKKTILEIKCPSKDSHLEALSGKVPEHYWPQVQFQLAVTGADRCHYFSYYDLNPEIEVSALVEVLPDYEYQGFLFTEALKFWDLVKSKTPPPLTDKDDKIVNEGKVLDICKNLLSNKDQMQKAELDLLKKQVIDHGGHCRIRCGSVLITKSISKNGKETYRLTIAKEECVLSEEIA